MRKFSNGIVDSVIPIVQKPAKLMIGEESIDRYFHIWRKDNRVIRYIYITTLDVDDKDAKDGTNWFSIMDLGIDFVMGLQGRKDEYKLIPYRNVKQAVIYIDHPMGRVKMHITPNGKECFLEE
jgi:hypothetical protein